MTRPLDTEPAAPGRLGAAGSVMYPLGTTSSGTLDHRLRSSVVVILHWRDRGVKVSKTCDTAAEAVWHMGEVESRPGTQVIGWHYETEPERDEVLAARRQRAFGVAVKAERSEVLDGGGWEWVGPMY